MLDRGPQPWLAGPLPTQIGIKGIGYYLGERFPIAGMKALAENPQRLRAFENRGFRYYTRSPIAQPDMALRACRESLRRASLCAADIDAVIIGWSEHRAYGDVQERVGTVPTRWLGFHCTHVLGIGMVGCCLHAELIRTARNFIVAEGYRNVLVVEANRTPDDDEERLTDPDLYVYSDGASACVVTTDKPEFKLRSVAHVTHGVPHHSEVGPRVAVLQRISNSFTVLSRALKHAGVTVADIKQFFMPNCSPHLVEMQARRNRIPFNKVFLDNTPLIAHPWSTDTTINIYNYCQFNKLNPGDLIATTAWSEGGFAAMVFERTEHPMLIEKPDLPPVKHD